MINNIVKQMISYKRVQFEEKMSSPSQFVQSMMKDKTAFQQILESQAATNVTANTQSKETLATNESINDPYVTQEIARRFSSAGADTWNVAQHYTIQPVLSKYKNIYGDIIQEMSTRYGVPKELIQKMIEVESSYNPNTVSSAGAMGLMQLMPENVKEQGVTNPFDPKQNIEAGVKEISGYLKKYNGDLVLSLAAYNAGPGNVQKYGGIPPFRETQNYIKKILNM
ncbi:lytic transglycosylase domain-containing protein [Microbacteriaceae bacterium 4G12]